MPAMHRALGSLSAYLPAALLLLFAAGAGTFAGAATAAGALAGHLALLLCLALAAGRWRDPLGRRGSLLLLALLLSVAASLLLSPVPRAGCLAVLLPAFLLVPPAVAECWGDARRRRSGVWAVSLVVAAVAAASLVEAWRLETAAALPLGHHNLLAAWLVTLLPVAVLPWRDGGGGRLLALAAGLLGLAALFATGSLAAAVAAAAVAVPAALLVRKGWLALALAAVFLGPQAPRLLGLVAGDPSLQARWGYLEAGWRGFAERPVFGWGPGATAWTIGEQLRPRPGIHPPDEVVADLHSLPLQLAYELGSSGLLLGFGVALIFWYRHRQAAADPGLRRAAFLGLAALAVMSLAGLPLSVTALPVAALVVVGGVLAAGGGRERPQQGSRRWPALAAGLAIAAVVLPLDLAQAAYDRAATAADPGEQARHLRRAVALDPDFPLYRARLAWLEAEIGGADREIARRAVRAAADAYGVAPLWLVAGVLAQETGGPGSREALERACRLSPLGALAPFRLALGEPTRAASAEWGARALLAEPRLAAATAWGARRELLAAAVGRAVAAPGVDAGWRQRLAERVDEGLDLAGPTRRIALAMDGEGSASLSLYAFRRRPWPAELVPVALSAAALARIDLVPAVGLRTTAPEVFNGPGLCGLP